MSHPTGGRLAELTRVAVARAAALTGRMPTRTPDAAALAALLYRAGGRVPDPRLDPRWPHHVAATAERSSAALLGPWTRTSTAHWTSWSRTDADPAALVHKVYVSPAVPDTPTAVRLVLSLAPRLDVPAWKLGADLAGLHRPDKLVLYTADAGVADDVARALAEALAHLDAQGVPFTGQVGATGVVSRGRDVAGTSWRADVCRRVADALVDARRRLGPDASATCVADAATARVRSAGVDTGTWYPPGDLTPSAVVAAASEEVGCA